MQETMRQDAPRVIEFLLLGVLATLWGSSYLFIKIAVEEIPPVTLIATRVTIASILLLLLLHCRGERLPRDGRIWHMLLIQSFFSAIGAWSLLAWGQQYLDAGLAAVLNSTSPIFVFLITALVTRHEAANALKLFGACLGLGGVVLIVGVDALNGLGQQVVAQLAALGGALLYGIAAIYSRNFSHLSAISTAAGTMLCASIVLVPLSLVLEAPWNLQPSAGALAAAMMLSVCCTGLAMLIYFRLARTLGSLGVASQAYLRAGFGVLLGIVFLGESFTPVVGLGLSAAILGVAAINSRRAGRPGA